MRSNCIKTTVQNNPKKTKRTFGLFEGQPNSTDVNFCGWIFCPWPLSNFGFLCMADEPDGLNVAGSFPPPKATFRFQKQCLKPVWQKSIRIPQLCDQYTCQPYFLEKIIFYFNSLRRKYSSLEIRIPSLCSLEKSQNSKTNKLCS